MEIPGFGWSPGSPGGSSRRGAMSGAQWRWKDSGDSRTWAWLGTGWSCPGETPARSPTHMDKAYPDFGRISEHPNPSSSFLKVWTHLEALFSGTPPRTPHRRSMELFCSSSATVETQAPHGNMDHLHGNIDIPGAGTFQMMTFPMQLVFNLWWVSLTK